MNRPSIHDRDPLIFPPDDDSLRRAAELLAVGSLVAIPTETVYGLAANAHDSAAAAAIFAAKGRPATNPLIVHVADRRRLGEAIAWPPPAAIADQLDRLADLWPGPLTLVCPKAAAIPGVVTAGGRTVAVRIPNHPAALQLLDRCPFPLAAPSANRSCYISPTLAEHVCDASGLGEAVAMVIDGGPCQHGVESTVLLLGESPRLLRPGAIAAEVLAERLGVPAETLLPRSPASSNPRHQAGARWQAERTADASLSPGTMPVHYAPKTPLILLGPAGDPSGDASEGGSRPAVAAAVSGRAGGPRCFGGCRCLGGLGRIAFRPLPPPLAARYRLVETLSDDGDPAKVAQGLFAALRRLDAAGLDEIHCDTCPAVGLGRAIMDRLCRAAARR